ncbi:MAG: hypothetical protein U0939_04660 [Pirellulales bacterium]
MSRSQPRRSSRRRLHLEALERREVLAGNVTASVVGSTLTLTGDGADNSLAIVALGNNRFSIAGLNTTINGSTAAFSPAGTILNITGNLGGGNDNLGLTNNAQGLDTLATTAGLDLEAATGLTVAQMQARIDAVTTVRTFALAGSLTVQGGAGNDLIGLVGNLGGSLTADLGAAGATGGNALGIDGTTVAGGVASIGGGINVTGGSQVDALVVESTKVGGSILAKLGAGNNTVDLFKAQVKGVVSVWGGNGNDFASLDSSTVAGAVSLDLAGGANSVNALSSTLGSWMVTTGAGNDAIDSAALTVRTNVMVSTGAGTDEITLHEHGAAGTNVAGLLQILTGAGNKQIEVSGQIGVLSIATSSGADDVTVYDSNITSAVINTASGNDSLTFDNVQVRAALTALLGDGADRLDMAGFDAVSATILTGAGNDILTIDDADIDVFYANLGAGNDTATMTRSSGTVATLDGGSGTDRLNIDNSTLAAIDHLFKLSIETQQII